jgi:hypothetical protein
MDGWENERYGELGVYRLGGKSGFYKEAGNLHHVTMPFSPSPHLPLLPPNARKPHEPSSLIQTAFKVSNYTNS